MTIYMQRIGARVPQNYTIDQALKAHLTTVHFDLDMECIYPFVKAMFSVMTESQQIRVLEQVGWVRCPGPTIEQVAAHHSV